ncbi:MAG: 2-oxoacid:acceptor oxidoreductase subunit alpha [Candidatus Syntrophonatronum acetioxidans]|uniref:2-oxoacid:acceptor oxidoreductase subunit alpha n=1 Tax=Candidatus Syntrophonatronum acetioxidans TaxID=1795816 RepID=A0A424YF74_9FIRM|nr:MAG: 2-oxoacid:acceptor oxidoreductase subunit alpha [Candidatus Syntrophonatronum acetioxidans]
MKKMFLDGNVAAALGAIRAGARFFAGYPISPVSELVEFCSRELPGAGGFYLQMEDEIAALAAVIGASLGGKKAFTATSGPGFSLMQENLGFASMAEVPCVIINGQRFGPSTGVATKPGQSDVMQARWGRHGNQSIITLTPASVQECFDLTVEAFNLAERFSSPALVLTDATLAHLRERIRVPDPAEVKTVKRKEYQGPPKDYKPYRPDERGVPLLSHYGSEYILKVTGLVHTEEGNVSSSPEVCASLIDRLERKIDDYQEELPPPRYYGDKEAETVLISFGISARAAREGAHRASWEGISSGLIQLQTVWPFPEGAIRELSSHASKIIVVEMNRGQVTREVERIIHNEVEVHSLLRTDSEVIYPREVLEKIKEVQ